MKKRGIIFRGDMVRATLGGWKTQTRRLNGLKRVNEEKDCWEYGGINKFDQHIFYPTDKGEILYGSNYPADFDGLIKCPYGVVGDRLWVKETWAAHLAWDGVKPSKIEAPLNVGIWYSADGKKHAYTGKTRPSIFMPRWASRITLEITDIRVERLQDITPEDAQSEGARWKDFGRTPHNVQLPGWSMEYPHPDHFGHCLDTARLAFGNYINIIHGGKNWNLKPTNLWDENPYVWVVEFKKL